MLSHRVRKTGPYAAKPGHELDFLGLSGFFAVPGRVDGAVTRPNVRIGDMAGALHAAHTDDAALYCDLLIGVPPASLMPGILADPHRAVDVARAMATLLGTDRSPEYGEAEATITWLVTIAEEAARAGELDLLEACCSGAFEWVAVRDRSAPRCTISPWPSTLTGDAASSAAAMLRQHPECTAHFHHLAGDVRVDHRIRAALGYSSTDETKRPRTR